MKKILLKNANLVLENKLMNGSILIFENKIEKIFTDNDNLSEITFDEISEDLYYCPTKARPSLTDFYGMKRYIRNETNEIEKNTDDKIQGAVIKAKNEKGRYVQGLPTAVATMKNFFRTGVSKFKNKKLTPKQRLLGLTDIGAALHILEDYFAHSNFCEVLLIKLGVNVYSWTDYTDPELQNYDSNGRFEVKNCIPPKKLNRKYEGAYLEKDTYFQDVMELYKHLNTQATCILLPSFEVEGFYFLYKPQGKERFELYFASNETKKLDEVELVGYREINTEKLKDISSSIPKIVHIPAEESVIEDIKSTSPTKTEVNSTQISATYVSSEDPFEKCIPERKEQILSYKGLTCYLDSSGFFEFDRIRSLIDVTDKFLFDLKGEGAGLQTLCFDRQNQTGIVPQQVIPERLHIKNDKLERNLQNLAALLPLNKVEEVRLVFLKHFFDAEHLVGKVALLLRNYPDVALKIIRVHSKGARDETGLSTHIPSAEETNALAAYARQCGINKVLTIL